MNLTEEIAAYITQLFNDEQNLVTPHDKYEIVSLSRKDLANQFNCVPSQINYVIRSRFSVERGFLTESQRGGNGYIKIYRLKKDLPHEQMRHYESLLGNTPNPQQLRHTLSLLDEQGEITKRERLLVEMALKHLEELSDQEFSLTAYRRDKIMASLLKRVLRCLFLQ